MRIQILILGFKVLTGLNMGGKTRNIAFQLVLQQCCKTSRTFLNWTRSSYQERITSHYKNSLILLSFFVIIKFQ